MCICRPFIVDDVTLFAVPGAVETQRVQDYLEHKGIRFEKLNLTEDEQARAEMIRLTGQTAHPVVVIGDQVFTGFDVAELDQVMP